VTTLAALVVVMNWPPNDREAGVKVVGAVPVPLNCDSCGEFDALSMTVKVPVRAPTAVGVNVTEIVQVSLVANVSGDSGQLDVCAKSPVAAMEAMVNGVTRLFWSVSIFAALAAPTD
jgi:hypothetical protein